MSIFISSASAPSSPCNCYAGCSPSSTLDTNAALQHSLGCCIPAAILNVRCAGVHRARARVQVSGCGCRTAGQKTVASQSGEPGRSSGFPYMLQGYKFKGQCCHIAEEIQMQIGTSPSAANTSPSKSLRMELSNDTAEGVLMCAGDMWALERCRLQAGEVLR